MPPFQCRFGRVEIDGKRICFKMRLYHEHAVLPPTYFTGVRWAVSIHASQRRIMGEYGQRNDYINVLSTIAGSKLISTAAYINVNN